VEDSRTPGATSTTLHYKYDVSLLLCEAYLSLAESEPNTDSI
jgi:hypothetical protein